MLRRFSLYGFLKNQRYFEHFIVLAFLEKGLSFFLIGVLVAFREITLNLFEVPSGAIADIWGRRRAMLLSFCAYIVSFTIFALSSHIAMLFAAMFFYAVGDAFRTGTHKAMIFTWLRLNGRENEKTRVYGYTRSWSKIGSAVCVVLAAAFVFFSRSYVYIFWFSIIPYLLGLINFLGYPAELDGSTPGTADKQKVTTHLRDALRAAATHASLRRLVFESMGYEGIFKAAKDYVQPVIAAMSGVIVARTISIDGLNEPQKAALVMGPVFLALYLLSALASRNAHRLVTLTTGSGTGVCEAEDRSARVLWGMSLLVFAGLLAAMYYGVNPAIVAGFVVLAILQNVWRPIHIGRFDTHSAEKHGATVLSIESQAKSLTTMIVAPPLGYAVDYIQRNGPGEAYWPVAALGAAVALLFFLLPNPKAGTCVEQEA